MCLTEKIRNIIHEWELARRGEKVKTRLIDPINKTMDRLEALYAAERQKIIRINARTKGYEAQIVKLSQEPQNIVRDQQICEFYARIQGNDHKIDDIGKSTTQYISVQDMLVGLLQNINKLVELRAISDNEIYEEVLKIDTTIIEGLSFGKISQSEWEDLIAINKRIGGLMVEVEKRIAENIKLEEENKENFKIISTIRDSECQDVKDDEHTEGKVDEAISRAIADVGIPDYEKPDPKENLTKN